VRALYLGAAALRGLGEEEEAQEWARAARAGGSEDPAVYYNLACFYALGGDTEEALSCLEKSVDYGFAHLEWLLNDQELKPLRHEPRFQAVTQRIGRR
jgi:adenylate cyclase